MTDLELEADADEVLGDVSGISSDVDYQPKPMAAQKPSKKPRKCIPNEWSDRNVYRLIGFVRKHPVLWDLEHKQRGVKSIKDSLWNEVTKKELRSKFHVADVNAKWKHIRVQYRNYLYKQTNSSRPANPIVWRFYPYMQFIDKINMEIPLPAEAESVNILSFKIH